jgi:hypothetical protein
MHPVAQGLAIHAAGLAMPQVLPCRRSCHAAGLAMPQVLAALVRSAPSRTIASANIRRDAALSFSRPAATRSSMAVKSLWVTAIAAIVLAPLHTKSPSIQTFSDSGIPHESSILAVGITSHLSDFRRHSETPNCGGPGVPLGACRPLPGLLVPSRPGRPAGLLPVSAGICPTLPVAPPARSATAASLGFVRELSCAKSCVSFVRDTGWAVSPRYIPHFETVVRALCNALLIGVPR